MFGWANAATDKASRRNLAKAWGSFERWSGRTLIATWRFKRVSAARYTSPIPPAPMGAMVAMVS
ncbi:MAG TPA: hypothetical protein VMH81_29595 [Bryobacteraceae bacterium]|nr:hypothetical protein [Bryobacteraceae bacterium]